MQKIDSLKFEVSKHLVSYDPVNYNKTVNEIYDCEYTSYKLRDNLKQSGLNGIFVNDTKCIIQISSKLVPENYYDMMNINNIERYFDKINSTGLIEFNVKSVIENSNVLSCDITNNIPDIENVATYINPLLIFKVNDKFICKHYKNESISFTKNLKKLAGGEHLKLYDKFTELNNYRNKENKVFVKAIDLENFKNVLRVESRFNNAKLMRKYFKIKKDVSELSLLNILNSNEKVNYNILDKITNIKNIDVKNFKDSKLLMEMREQKIRRATIENRAGKIAIIKSFNFDIEQIRNYINIGSTETSNNSAVITEYKELIKSLKNDVDTFTSIDERVNEIKSYLKVA